MPGALAEADGVLADDEVVDGAVAGALALATEEQLTESVPPAALQFPLLVLLLFVVLPMLQPAVISPAQASVSRVRRVDLARAPVTG